MPRKVNMLKINYSLVFPSGQPDKICQGPGILSKIHVKLVSVRKDFWHGFWLAGRHYLNQWWLDYWCIYVSLGLSELSTTRVIMRLSMFMLIYDVKYKRASITWQHQMDTLILFYVMQLIFMYTGIYISNLVRFAPAENFMRTRRAIVNCLCVFLLSLCRSYWLWGCLKNTYKLLNLGALKYSLLNKLYSYVSSCPTTM